MLWMANRFSIFKMPKNRIFYGELMNKQFILFI